MYAAYFYLPPPGDGVAAGGLTGLAPGLADDVRVVAQVSRYLYIYISIIYEYLNIIYNIYSLRCPRTTVHAHMFLSLALNNVAWLLW